ncbi:MAG: NAD(P)-dependent oxidoreductase [Proteobacteria bacterium]|nr:NAD(P)-dependent oxidoreductase [Pseudomonadota bacterium]
MAVKGPDIAGKRLDKAAYAANFADLHPPLTEHEALVESDRCFFCHDAPCQTACPTSIDIPLFIREINTGHPKSAAKTIFDQNILGGMCARVCPTETLCEEACVRETSEGKPVKIGQLQRYATDAAMETNAHPYVRAMASGRKVAVVGAGPAGLACAHRLSLRGHDVTIFEARKRPGGLNEFGIAAYKSVNNFAQREVDFVLGIGGIAIETGKSLGKGLTLDKLQKDFDAVFLGIGLQGVNDLGIKNDDAEGIEDAVDYIAELRQASDLSKLKIGRRVLVIGGGMTAVDAAVQSKLLGAEDVTILYRRGAAQMKASSYEQELAQTRGVVIKHWVAPKKVVLKGGKAAGLICDYMAEKKGKLVATGETCEFPADMIFKAIGQTYIDTLNGALALEGGRIKVDGERRTSLKAVWAGGDCAAGGKDLTVAAVDDGRRAAESIHAYLSA